MVVTVTGGSGSGKSRMAEEISQALCGGRKLYIATMIVCDEESRKRMERHQRQRAGMYFETVERPFGLERLTFKEKERLINDHGGCMNQCTDWSRAFHCIG